MLDMLFGFVISIYCSESNGYTFTIAEDNLLYISFEIFTFQSENQPKNPDTIRPQEGST